jgi:hypothetical protein
MKTLQRALGALKSKMPAFNHAGYTANALALREDYVGDPFPGTKAAVRPVAITPHMQPVSCCAQTDAGKCGVTPAPFLDFKRGGFVCPAHKPQPKGGAV